jgi:hypothetical protein
MKMLTRGQKIAVVALVLCFRSHTWAGERSSRTAGGAPGASPSGRQSMKAAEEQGLVLKMRRRVRRSKGAGKFQVAYETAR